MSDQEKQKTYKTEWSFSFGELGDRIDEFVRSLGASGEEVIQTEHFSEPLGGTTQASVRLDTPVGRTFVHAGAPETLIEAEITHVGDVEFAIIGDADKRVTLSQKSDAAQWLRGFFGWIGSSGRLRWDVALTPAIPLALDIYSGVGEAKFDLRNLKLTSVEVHGGTGEIDLYLPATGALYPAVINGGVGEFDIEIAPGAEVTLQARAGTGEIELEIGAGAAVQATIKGGLGQCKIRLPEGAAARIEASMGLGDLNVSRRLTRVQGVDGYVSKSGVWQTPDFETAERKIDIKFEGGVGGLSVR